MLLIGECVILCLLFHLLIYRLVTKNPLSMLHNYPESIRKRVYSLPAYSHLAKRKTAYPKKIAAGLLAALLLALLLPYANGYETFFQGAAYAYLIWTALNIYDALVIDILWFCHSPKVVIAGTEDMQKEYRDYGFHLKRILHGTLLGLPAALACGGMVTVLP